MDPYVFKRLWRRPWLSLCSLILSLVLCFLVGYLSGYRQEQQEKLAETKDSFAILCVVSNRHGTQSRSLRMGAMAYTFVTDPEMGFSQHVRELRVTKEFYFSCPALGIMAPPGQEPIITGVSNAHCADELDPALGAEVFCQVEDFYTREDNICLVSQEVWNRIEGEYTVTLNLTDPMVNQEYNPGSGKGSLEFQVVGYYPGSGDDMFMPFPTSQKLGVEVSGWPSTDSISFLAADNQNLEAISRDAAGMFGAVDPMASEFADPKLALTIHDQQYRATVAALEQNIDRTNYLLPLVLILGLGVGFLISLLATRNETRTYALMRTMGMTQGRLFFSILREQMVLTVLAALLALAMTLQVGSTLVYIGFNTVGCIVSVIRAVRTPPTAILRDQE